MSHCCTGPVHVSNGCIQWCETDYDLLAFGRCAHDSIGNLTVGGIATCNGNSAGRVAIGGGMVGTVVLLWVLVQGLL